MTIQKEFQHARHALELTQKELAKQADVTTLCVWRMEHGKLLHKDWRERLIKVADALESTIEDLFYPEYLMELAGSTTIPHHDFLLEFVKLKREPFSKDFLLDLLDKLCGIPPDELPNDLVEIQAQAKEYLHV